MQIVTLYNGDVAVQIHDYIAKLETGKIVKGINTIDSFTFSMLPNNPGFNLINEYTAIVEVYNPVKRKYEFVGRVLYAETTMDEEGLITKTVTCENVLGYLCDSQQAYVDTRNWTVSGLLQHLLDTHNSQVESYKHFHLGTVTAADGNNNLYQAVQRENTWAAIGSKLIGKIGGELQVRIEDDGLYLDYLEQIGGPKETEIALSVNMRAITREQDPTAFVTRLIPLGCKLKNDAGEETEHRLDITSVNGGVNYIEDAEAVARYGIHVGIVEWDDVTTASALLSKGKAWLKENNKVQVKYSITALDLSLIGLAFDDFDVGNTYPIKNGLLGIDDTARITKKTIDICEEVESSIEIGDSFKTLTDIQREQTAQLAQTTNAVKSLELNTNSNTSALAAAVTDLDERTTLSVQALQAQDESLAERVADLEEQTGELDERLTTLTQYAGAMADFITETGTSSPWLYRKWVSGRAECWCSMDAAPVTLTYPFTFDGDPCVQATEYGGKFHYYAIGTLQ